MLRRIVLLGVAVALLEASGLAQCRAGYAGAGYYRDSGCREFVIPKAYSFGGEFVTPFAGPTVFPGPFHFGYPLLLPPQIPSHYFRPWYFEPPQSYPVPSANYGYYPTPPASVPARAMPPQRYQYRSSRHRRFESRGRGFKPKRKTRIVRSGNGVWTNE